MAPGNTAPLSFEKSAIVWAAPTPANDAVLRHPVAGPIHSTGFRDVDGTRQNVPVGEAPRFERSEMIANTRTGQSGNAVSRERPFAVFKTQPILRVARLALGVTRKGLPISGDKLAYHS